MGLEPVITMPHADPTDPGRPGTPMDQHDRYLLPDPSGEREGLVPFTRASTVKGRAQKGESLKTWNEIMLAKGLAIAPDLVALVASTPLGAPGSRDILLEATEQAKVRAGARASANLGSALHAFTEQIDKGEPLADVLERVPDALKPDVQAYADMLVRYGLTPVPELVERIVVNLKLQTGLTWDGKPGTRKDAAAGVAARFDRMYRWTDPEGRTWLIPGDLKTGKNAVAYGALETCVQEAIAARADWLWNEEAEAYEDMPGSVAPGAAPAHAADQNEAPQLRMDLGLLIHLPVGTGTCEPEELDLELGWELAQLAVRLMIVDKAKDHCHRPFMLQAPEDAPTLREADVDEAPAPEESGRLPLGSPETADRLAEARQAQRTEPKRVEVRGGRKPEDGVAADGSPLQPLARDVPGRRGCSLCGRVGHRKGSAACWGDTDPAKLAPAATCASGVCETDGECRQLPDCKAPATVPVPAGVIACGPDGAVTELTPGDAAAVQEFADQLQNMATAEEPAPAAPPCPHAGGFTRSLVSDPLHPEEPPAERFVCADCGQETERAADARRAREAMDSPGPRSDRASAQPVDDEAPREPAIPDENRSTDPQPEPEDDEVCPGDPTHYRRAHDVGGAWYGQPLDHGDPFAAPAAEPELSPEDRIRACTKREELSTLRKEGLRDGWWTDAHTTLGLEMLRAL